MATDTPIGDAAVAALTARLDRLERSHRRLKRAGALAVVAGAGLLLMGQAADRIVAQTVSARRVETESLVVRDATGKIRALLEPDPAGPSALTVSDKEGRERLALGVGPGGGVGLVFRDREGAIRAAMGVGPSGRPFVVPKRHRASPGSPGSDG